MANKELKVKIRDAYDTEFNWKTNNPVLLAGQVAFSSDKYGKYKVGDGVKTWNQLEYAKTKWEDIDGKPSTFNPTTHNHDDRYYTETEMNTKLGEKADVSHTHDSGVVGIDEKSTEGTRYVKIADSTCSFYWQRINQQILLTSKDESILLNLKCHSVDSTKFTKVTATYTPLSSNPGSLYESLFIGLINVDTDKNRIEIWYKQGQWGASLNIIPLGKTKEGYALTFYKHNATEAGSASLPTFAIDVPLIPVITKNTLGLGNVDNTADNQKTVKYATSSGNASSVKDAGDGRDVLINFSKANSTAFNYFGVWENSVLVSTDATQMKAKLGLNNVSNTADSAKSVKYATSAGSATTATKLGSSNIGSLTQPMFLNAGTPTACAYTLGKSVPSDAVFTDTNTWNPLKGATTNSPGSAGYAPAPSAGAANRYLRSDGTWAVPPDTNTTYTLGSFGVTATAQELNYCDGVTGNIQTQLNGKAASNHSHSGYASSTHTHTASQISGLPTIEAITDSEIDSLKNL